MRDKVEHYVIMTAVDNQTDTALEISLEKCADLSALNVSKLSTLVYWSVRGVIFPIRDHGFYCSAAA